MPSIVNRNGETNKANNGRMMTIIDSSKGSKHLTIQFEDGEIVYNKSYSHFKNGQIRHPKDKECTAKSKRNTRIGETKVNSDGQIMTIIDQNSYYDMTIQFEDGFILEHCSYDRFARGSINRNWKNHIGQTNINAKGQKMTIIKYNDPKNFTIQFEDGLIKNCNSLANFLTGHINHPNDDFEIKKKERLNKSIIANNGQKMTIIDYKTSHDIKVQFEDGTIVNTTYTAFNNKTVSNPNYTRSQYIANKYIGKSTTACNGLKMTIIAYRSAKDIDIQFEDGVIVYNIAMSSFYNKVVPHPHKSTNRLKNEQKYLGLTKNHPKLGINMKIIEVINSHDLTVQFETGYIIKHKYGVDFLNGKIKHSFPYQIDNMIIEKHAYTMNNIGNFYCTCTKCNHKDIMNIEEMKHHICKEN